MKTEHYPPHARVYVDDLAASGRHHFTSADAQKVLGVSPAAAKLALGRLAKQKLVASPARGFYVIVPPEYRALGCLPGDQFIPALMQWQGLSYYAGLLLAAQYYGAAHHAPQVFQVLLPRRRLNIACGAVRVAFYARRNLSAVATRKFNTPRGTIAVSTPEATAIDLVGYHHHVGGFDGAAAVGAASWLSFASCRRGRSSRAVERLCESTGARLCAASIVGRLRPSQTRSELEAIYQ